MGGLILLLLHASADERLLELPDISLDGRAGLLAAGVLWDGLIGQVV